MLTDEEIQQRQLVWEALSDLFLDTQNDGNSYQAIARAILSSPFTPEEIGAIYWQEVFPAFGGNLQSVAGEWTGFNSEWLREHILSCIRNDTHFLNRYGFFPLKSLINFAQEELTSVSLFLPSEISETLLMARMDLAVDSIYTPKRWWQFW